MKHQRNTRNINKLSKTLWLALSTFAVTAQGAGTTPLLPGELDPTFGVNGVLTTHATLANYGLSPIANAQDSSGNIIVTGKVLNANNDIFIARINAAGQLDSQFGDNGITLTDLGSNDSVSALLINTNNQPIIRVHSDGVTSLRRYTQSGLPDTNFGTDGVVTVSSSSNSTIAIDSQNRILSYSGPTLSRLLSDGAVDESFGEAGSATIGQSTPITIAVDKSDNIFIASNSGTTVMLAKYQASGQADSDFATDGQVEVDCCTDPGQLQIAFDSQDNIAVAVEKTPSISNPSDTWSSLIYRFTPTGQLDSSFADNGVLLNQYESSGQPVSFAIDSSDNLWLTSRLFKYFGPVSFGDQPKGYAIYRYNSQGLLDSRFSSDGILPVTTALTSKMMGSLLIDDQQVSVLMLGDQLEPVVSRFDLTGQFSSKTAIASSVEQAFGTIPTTLTLDAQGQILLTGGVDVGASSRQTIPFISRFDALGQPDLNYGQGNGLNTAHYLGDIKATDSAGNYLVLGPKFTEQKGDAGITSNNVDFSLVRYHHGGEVDMNFGTDGAIAHQLEKQGASFNSSAAFTSDGKVLLAAGDVLYRYHADGQPDSSFGSNGRVNYGFQGSVTVKPQRNGDIFVAGDNSYWDSRFSFFLGGKVKLVKYDNSGTPVSRFGTEGQVTIDLDGSITQIYAMTTDSLGKIVLVGQKDVNDSRSTVLLRFLANGQLDGSFGTDGVVVTALADNLTTRNVIIDSNSNIIVSGTSDTQVVALRYNSDGLLDVQFSEDGIAKVSQNNNTRHESGLVLDDTGYLYLSTTIGEDGGLLKMYSGYPSLESPHGVSVTFNGGNSRAITSAEFAFEQTLADVSQITLLTIPAGGQLFIDANGNGLQDDTEATLKVGDVISKTQLDAGLLFYTPGATELSTFEYSIDQQTTSQLMRLLVNPAPQATISSSSDTASGDSSENSSENSITTNPSIPVQISFSETVYGFSTSQFTVTNATIDGNVLSGDGKTFTLTLTASNVGQVILDIPQGATVDYDGISNPAALWSIIYTNQLLEIGGTPITSVDEDSAYAFTPTVVSGDNLTFSIVNKPDWATFDTTTGALTGTPENDDVAITQNIVISMSNGVSTVSLTPFDLEVINTNDAPVISGTPAPSIDEGQTYRFTPTATDVDANTTLTFEINNRPTWANFDTTTGTLSGTPGNDAVGITMGIVISVTDGDIRTSLPSFDLEVVNVNNAPVIAGTPNTAIHEGQPYSFTPTASDIDADDTLRFNITNKPNWLNFDNRSGQLSGTPTNADVGTTVGIVISVTDGQSSTALPSFNLEVIDVNGSLLITATPITSINEDQVLNFIPTVINEDINETLSFNIINKPIWANFDNTTGALTGTPLNEHVGITTGIVISVTEGEVIVSLPAFNLTVLNTNDAPQISGSPATSVDEDQPYTFTPTAIDVDSDDNLSFAISNKPDWAMFDDTTGTLTGTPLNDDVGTVAEIVISVTDGQVNTALPTFNLEVVNSNDAPQISGLPTTSIDQDEPYNFTPTASDEDIGDTLSFGITNKPDWAAFDVVTGALTGTPAAADVGNYDDIVISVLDSTLATNSIGPFSIEVVQVASPVTPPVTPPAQSSGGGGSFGFKLFLMMVLVAVRRRFSR